MRKRKRQSDSFECKGSGCDAFGNVIDDGASVLGLAYTQDDLSRPIARNDDAFAYNARGGVVFSRGGRGGRRGDAVSSVEGPLRPPRPLREEMDSRRGTENAEDYSYDEIGNRLHASFNLTTNIYTANKHNQYTSISTLRGSAAPCEANPTYDADGNLISYGPWSYTYDSASQLVTVSSNGVLLVTNQYGLKSLMATCHATSPVVYA